MLIFLAQRKPLARETHELQTHASLLRQRATLRCWELRSRRPHKLAGKLCPKCGGHGFEAGPAGETYETRSEEDRTQKTGEFKHCEFKTGFTSIVNRRVNSA